MKLFDFSFKNSRKLPLFPWCIWLFPWLHCVTGTLFLLTGSKKQLKFSFQGSSINQYTIKKTGKIPIAFQRSKSLCCQKKKRCLNEINGWQHVAEPERTECLGKRENHPFNPKQTSSNTHAHTRFYHNSITDHRVGSVHFNLFIHMYCMYRCALQERWCAPRNCGLPYDDRVSVTDMNTQHFWYPIINQ